MFDVEIRMSDNILIRMSDVGTTMSDVEIRMSDVENATLRVRNACYREQDACLTYKSGCPTHADRDARHGDTKTCRPLRRVTLLTICPAHCRTSERRRRAVSAR